MTTKYYVEDTHDNTRYVLSVVEIENERGKTVEVKSYQDLMGRSRKLKPGGRKYKAGQLYDTLPEAIAVLSELFRRKIIFDRNQ